MDAPKQLLQLDLFEQPASCQPEGGTIVKVSQTDLGQFGNRIDIFELGSTGRGTSLLECDDEDVSYFNNFSANPTEDCL